MTNSGSDIKVGRIELVDHDLRHADQRLAGDEEQHRRAEPSTRKIGMPAGEQAEEHQQEQEVSIAAASGRLDVRHGDAARHLMLGGVADGHGRGIEKQHDSGTAGST